MRYMGDLICILRKLAVIWCMVSGTVRSEAAKQNQGAQGLSRSISTNASFNQAPRGAETLVVISAIAVGAA